ncbi:AI-2E family transporter [Jiangella sp. DSM 45060]|uniref:AI-2E family transporter n=1 Tax=Jiangella sp. DSM 45060 TaxID=1798224 RepID=UPI00087934F6|nr:AI-2E family transporter [Jiangella sp. DSM 45060]SDT51994.1 Predicted PurR-regulated permease PerM [Jiangella sp. DSM 45060]
MTRWLTDVRQRLAQAADAGPDASRDAAPDASRDAGGAPRPASEPPAPGPVPPPPAATVSPSAPDRHPVPKVVRDAAEWSWRLLIIAAAVAGVGWLAWELRLVIFPLVAALLLAAGLQPLVRRLRRAGWARGPASAVVFVGFLLVVVGSLTLVGNAVGGQFQDVVDQAEEGLQEIRDWLAGPPFSIDEAQLDRYIDRAVAVFQDDSAVTEQAATAATVAIEILVGLALALFALIFFLYDGERIWTWVVRLFPSRARARAAAAGDVAWLTLGQYIRGTVLVALFDAVAITILLFILQVPLALPLGVLVFFGAFVPLIGAFVTGTVAVLVALVTQGLLIAIVVLVGLIVVQQIESNIFQPFILGRMVSVHPLAVAVAVAIGTLAGSIIGAIIAVPIIALVNTVGSYLASTRERPPPVSSG